MKPKKNRFIAIAAASVAFAIPAFAADGTWNTTIGGALWTLDTNWVGNVIADGSGSTADFNQVDLTATTAVSLNGDRTIGNLIFGDTNTASGGGWNLNGPGVLTLDGGTPTITVNALAPLGDYSTSASISAGVAGTSGLTKEGAGRLILSGGTANTLSGPITVNAGMLGSLNSASLQNMPGAITVASGATFDAKAGFGASIANNFILSGTGSGLSNYGTVYGALNIRENASLTGAITLAADTLITHDWNIAWVNGSITGTDTNLELQTLQAGQYGFYMGGPISLGTGALTLTGIGTVPIADFNFSGTNSYTGGTLLKGGRVTFNNGSALGSGTVTFVSNTSLTGTANMTHANALTVNTGVAATLGADASTGWTQSGAVTGDGTLTKSGLGAITLSAGTSNTFTGAITVSAGMLASNDSASLQNMTGAITVASGATFDARANWAGSIPTNFILSGTGSGINGSGALNIMQNAVLTGAITLTDHTKITHDWNYATISGSITGTNTNLQLTTLVNHQPPFSLTGPVNLGTGGVTVTGAGGSNTVNLFGTLNYTGETVVTSGTLKLGGTARLADSSTVRITSGAVLDLDFAGTDTVAALYLNGAPMPPGTYGSLTSSATNQSADFLGAGILDVVSASSYSTWAAANSIPGQPASGDFDNDGLTNIVEYALALSPTVSSVPPGTFNGSLLSFNKGAEAMANGDVTYEIEQSTTLSGWTVVVPNAPASASISYTLPSGQPKEFARLKITQIP